eukprot:1879128-Rhodomonas_salina.1
MPQPGGAPLPPATPAKRKHVKKKTVVVPPPAHATHDVAASGEHANSSESWLHIPDERDPSTEGNNAPFADDSLGGDPPVGESAQDVGGRPKAFTTVEDDVLVE